MGYCRWRICALLFFATTINYMDRQVLGILAPDLQRTIGWNEIQYGYLITAFQAAYAIGLLLVGRLIDRVGTRIGYALAITMWSLSAMGHALARSVMGFGIARFLLGLGESGNFPAGIKTVAEWFPKKERALATGIFNSGTNVGAIVAPLLVPWVALHLGWRWAFLITGVFSATWLVAWLTFYRRPQEHPRVSMAELALIQSDPPESLGGVAWSRRLGKSLEHYHLFWLEDPVPAESQESFRIIRQHTTTPLAIGEVFNTIYDCQQLIQEQLIDYIRTTVVHAGGITHLKKIANLAEICHVRTGSHGATDLSPVCMAAALHFDLSVHNFGIQEYMRHPQEADRVFPHAYKFADGVMHPGDAPGLGVNIDEKLAAQYPYQRAYLPINRKLDGTMHSW